MSEVRRYHGLLVGLHWVLALMISLALFMGSTALEHMANTDPGKVDAVRAHMSVGLLIGVLLVLRLFTRLSTQHPPHASTGMAWADRLAPLAHWSLYGLVALMVASGVGMALAFDLPAVVLEGQGHLPEFSCLACAIGARPCGQIVVVDHRSPCGRGPLSPVGAQRPFVVAHGLGSETLKRSP